MCVLVHVLVAHRRSKLRPRGVARSHREARAAAESILDRARNGEDLAELALDLSDEPFGRRHAGRVEVPFDTTLAPFREAARLPVGTLCDVVESEYGFHVLQRLA